MTTICEGLRGDIAARGIAADRITVIPNAVDVDDSVRERDPTQALRKRLGLDGATVIGFAGSFYAYEGLDLLIEAAAAVGPAPPGLSCCWSAAARRSRRCAAGRGSAAWPTAWSFTGRVPHDEVQRYYDLIDVLAYPRHRCA